MKKILLYLLLVFIGLFCIDRIGGVVMKQIHLYSNDVLSPKLRYIQNSIHEDIVLLGASRCHHHYVSEIIEDSLGMSVYNAGIGGANNIFSHYIILNHILARYTPKMICLEVMPTDYNIQKNPFSVISFFAPLFGENERADSVFLLSGSYWKYNFSHLYRYNAKAPSILWGLVMNRQNGRINGKGYIPLSQPMQGVGRIHVEEKDITIDSLKIDYLHLFVNQCKQRGVQLVFVVSPKYTKITPSHYDVLEKFANSHGIPFLNYHTKETYLDKPDYFRDFVHLWEEGAKCYSSMFAKDLKYLLGNNKNICI